MQFHEFDFHVNCAATAKQRKRIEVKRERELLFDLAYGLLWTSAFVLH